MNLTRRRVLVGTGFAIAGVAGASTAFAAQDNGSQPNITFGETNAEEEWLVLHNEGDSAVSIQGYYLNWEHANDNQDQWDQFTDDTGATSIPAGDSITVASGYKEVEDADVTFDNDAGRMNNNQEDVYAIMASDQETVIARSDEDQRQAGSSPTATPTDTETATEPETKTATATATETETATPTDSSETGC